MLIKVFTVWLLTSNINYLLPSERGGENCIVIFNNATQAAQIIGKTCDEVAAEINNQLRAQKP